MMIYIFLFKNGDVCSFKELPKFLLAQFLTAHALALSKNETDLVSTDPTFEHY